jgi:hypothetical protein
MGTGKAERGDFRGAISLDRNEDRTWDIGLQLVDFVIPSADLPSG